jgi:hypothetical protein
VEERFERQARNETLMRTVNDQIAAVDKRAAGWAGAEERFAFQCECGRIGGCDGRVLMTMSEYARVRSQRDRFCVVPGHENDQLEEVVERDERYVIVDKRDEIEHLVE